MIILASWQATTPTRGAIRPAPGTHEELLAKEGRYYELWNMQQGIYRSKKKAEPKQPVMQAVVEEDDDGESITY